MREEITLQWIDFSVFLVATDHTAFDLSWPQVTQSTAKLATKHGSSRFPSQAYGTSVRLTALYGPLQQGSELQVVPT